MSGLYALKPWYAGRLHAVRGVLVTRRVPPDAITAAGVAFGAATGGVLWLVPAGAVAGFAVAGLLAARLACANLDGGVARESGRVTRFGTVTNEVGDRLAELAALAGLLAWASPALVAAAALAVGAPSRVSLMSMAAGEAHSARGTRTAGRAAAPRLQGGPFGKTERCVVLVGMAVTGLVTPLLLVLIVGSLVTAVLRLHQGHRLLRDEP
jgi:CDP-diacylglycerol--glycerol-3-phosphate 3-phosphatidyltransferase